MDTVTIELTPAEAVALEAAADRGYCEWGIHPEDDFHIAAVEATKKIRNALGIGSFRHSDKR